MGYFVGFEAIPIVGSAYTKCFYDQVDLAYLN